MRRITFKHIGLTASTIMAVFGLAIVPAVAVATRPGVEAPVVAPTPAASATNDAKSQARLKLIISRGNKEIDRRLKTLNTLSVQINGAKKLSSVNKTALNNEVKAEINSLTALKQKLSADTDLATAQADAQSIFSGYRVYALIAPKVQLVRTADSQQVAEERLTTLAGKLQTRITEAKSKGKDVASLQTAFNDMVAKTKSAQAVSSAVEASVIDLQPSDYNANRSILTGQRDKLKAAQDTIKAAVTDAKTVVNGLRNL